MIRLVCIDVDGTLVGASGEVHPRVWPAAARLRAAGIRLAVCSGRPGFGHARDYAARLESDGWHVFQNGASVVHLGTGASRSAGLPEAALAALVAQARTTGHTLELYGDEAYLVEPGHADPGDRPVRHAALLGVAYSPGRLDDGTLPAGRVVRAQWMLPTAALPAVLADPIPGTRLVPSTSPLMPDTAFVSVLAPGVDKAAAVAAVAAAYAVPLDAIMMVGDGANDAAAMRAVGEAGGHPVAMGNAEPEAIAEARHRVGDVDAGGLADALVLAGSLRRRAA